MVYKEAQLIVCDCVCKVYVHIIMGTSRIAEYLHACNTNSLGSRPPPFRARFNYTEAANIQKTVIKTRTERGRPGTDAITQTQGVVIMQVHAPGVLSWVHNASLILSRDVRIDIESIGACMALHHT